MISFEEDLKQVINRHSAEAPSGTPDYILAKLLTDTLKTFNEVVGLRAEWRGETLETPKKTSFTLEDVRQMVCAHCHEPLSDGKHDLSHPTFGHK